MPSIARTHQLNQSLLYHIYNRGNARSQIFHDDEDYLYFFENIEYPRGSQEFLAKLVKEKGLYLPRRRGKARKELIHNTLIRK